jgi:energy-coupling factor transporter ATP-binding protein EcfA2
MVRDDDFVGEAGSMGHGLQMWLQTMWFLTRVQGAGCVILDEPDVYMHPDLQRRLIRYLRNRHHQVIVATHSVEIMSEVEPDDILVVDRKRRSSGFTSDAGSVQRLVEHIGSVHNLQLARLWNAKKCLLVEGRDVKLLSIVHRKLFPEAESLETTPHIEIGGWGGWPYAIGSSLLLRNSGGEDITVYCVLDRDYHSDDAVERRLEEATRNRVILHVWTRKEIENYFICPEAILRAIIRRMPARTATPVLSEITSRLEAICDSLKDETFDAIAAEVLAEDRTLGAGGANKAARQILADRWASFDGKLGTVSGKRLLAEVSQWTQEQFGSSVSAAVLAREMSISEVPDEVRSVVASIQNGRSIAPPERSRRPARVAIARQ